MADVANVNAGAAGLAPDVSRVPGSRVEYHTLPEPITPTGTQPGRELERPAGVNDRPQRADVATFTRDWWIEPPFSGAHGVVGLPRPAPNLEGGQEVWPNWSPRTFRSAPMVPWDEAGRP